MRDITPTTFQITREEVEDVFDDMELLEPGSPPASLSEEQIVRILEYVECDEFLAKDIRRSVEGAVREVVGEE